MRTRKSCSYRTNGLARNRLMGCSLLRWETRFSVCMSAWCRASKVAATIASSATPHYPVPARGPRYVRVSNAPRRTKPRADLVISTCVQPRRKQQSCSSLGRGVWRTSIGGLGVTCCFWGTIVTPRPGSWAKVGESLSKIPSSLPLSSAAELELVLRAADSALPATLAWIFSSFRGQLIPLDKQVVSSFFPPGVQHHVRDIRVFLTYPSNEKRLLAFRKRREIKGRSSMLFHDAVWPKWHTIIRTELKE